MNNIIDHEIVVSFQRGEKEAFKTIYNHYYKRIYYFVYQHCSNEEIANDIVQNTFIAAYCGITHLKQVKAFHSWLYSIAYNELIAIMKKENIQTKNQNTAVEVDQLIDQSHRGIHKEIKNRELSRLITHSIETLNPKLKDVVILRYYEELSIKEISFILHIPIGTVKSRLNRANEIMQNNLSIQGVTPKTYATNFVITPPLIMDFINSIPTPANIGTIGIDNIIHIAKSTSKPSFFSLIKNQKNIAAAIFLTVSSLVLYIHLSDMKPSGGIAPPEYKKPVLVACQFDTITYDTNFTNTSIPIDITTTNDNFDQILINGLDTRTIDENGTYLFILLKNGTIIDQRELVIDNIDRISPEIVSINRQEDTYIVQFKDDGLGIDPKSILYYFNGNPSKNYTYDANTNIITFVYTDFSSNIIVVKDFAGNIRKVFIESEHYYQNNGINE